MLSLIVVAAIGAGVVGCNGTSLRNSSRSTTATTGSETTDSAEYLRALRREQARLAVAERAIPRRPRTPAQLSRSIGLLARAIDRLGDDLAAIRPPSDVSAQHVALVVIVRAYGARLERAARAAISSGSELRAGKMLLAATTQASSKFSSTVSTIDTKLGQ